MRDESRMQYPMIVLHWCHHHPAVRFILACVVFLFVEHALFGEPIAANAVQVSSRPPVRRRPSVSPPSARTLMNIRCGWRIKDNTELQNENRPTEDDDTVSCWVYTGSLYDPLVGREICSVEGVELVQGLAFYADDDESSRQSDGQMDSDNEAWSIKQQRRQQKDRFQRRCRDMQVAQNDVVHCTSSDHSNSTRLKEPYHRECGTLLSRKLFCYTTTGAVAENDTSVATTGTRKVLLQSIPKRPGRGSRETPIPFNQAVTVYDSAISFLSSSSSTKKQYNDDETANGDDQSLIVHTEFPNGRGTWSKAQFRGSPPFQSSSSSIEFSVTSRLQNRPFAAKDWSVVTSHTTTNATQSSTAAVSPPRSAWIQFGTSTNSGGSRQGGSAAMATRETYQYYYSSPKVSNNNGDVSRWNDYANSNDEQPMNTVRYTRYGEAPVWYGPGRYCQLDMVGHRIWTKRQGQTQPPPKLALFARHSNPPSNKNDNENYDQVPVAASIIARSIPQFWQFGVASRPVDPVTTEQRRLRRKEDDEVFAYYAKALQPAMEREETDQISTDKRMSSHRYRQYYRDLAIGRHVDQFRQQSQWMIEERTNHGDHPSYHQPILRALCDCGTAIANGWSRFRSATSFSIGRNLDNE